MKRIDEPLDPLDVACGWVFAAHRGFSKGGAFDHMMPDDIKAYLLQHVAIMDSIPVYGPDEPADEQDDPRHGEWMDGFTEGFGCGLNMAPDCGVCAKYRDRNSSVPDEGSLT